jgi:hypothetical protein
MGIGEGSRPSTSHSRGMPVRPWLPAMLCRPPTSCGRDGETADDSLMVGRSCGGERHVGWFGGDSVALFAWLISHQPTVLFSQNKPATSNQPTVLFSQNEPAPAISHQPNEQAARLGFGGCHCRSSWRMDPLFLQVLGGLRVTIAVSLGACPRTV